jgi:hypothetical protein
VMVATDGVADAHVTWLVRFCVELSEKVPVAVNCCVVPFTIVGLTGVTASDTNAGATTVSTVEPVKPLSVAEILEVPCAKVVASPALLIVATAGVAEAHVTWLVRFCVELSEKVPVAVNCSVFPLATLGLAGVTAIDFRAAAVTVNTVEPTVLPSVALMLDVPGVTPVASPPAVIVATAGVADAHVTWLVRFCVELSENVPVAVNCWVFPLATLGLAGVTAIDCNTAADTVKTVEPVTLPSVALMLDVPGATPVASPPAVIVATDGVADAHVTWLVRFCVELSEKVPVTVNCCVSPLATLGLAGVTAID